MGATSFGSAPCLPLRHQPTKQRRNGSGISPGVATVEAGKWVKHGPERVEVPASLILRHGRWIAVRQGVQGLLVRHEAGVPAVYVLCEPASHYYEVMTRSKWAPVLVGERI
jgi:hypothetical protein